jgi:hypothetical protein
MNSFKDVQSFYLPNLSILFFPGRCRRLERSKRENFQVFDGKNNKND